MLTESHRLISFIVSPFHSVDYEALFDSSNHVSQFLFLCPIVIMLQFFRRSQKSSLFNVFSKNKMPWLARGINIPDKIRQKSEMLIILYFPVSAVYMSTHQYVFQQIPVGLQKHLGRKTFLYMRFKYIYYQLFSTLAYRSVSKASM